MEGFGLKTLPGSDGEMNVNEDVEAISKGYQLGDNIQFTVNINACFDAEKQEQEVPEDNLATGTIIDAEISEE